MSIMSICLWSLCILREIKNKIVMDEQLITGKIL